MNYNNENNIDLFALIIYASRFTYYKYRLCHICSTEFIQHLWFDCMKFDEPKWNLEWNWNYYYLIQSFNGSRPRCYHDTGQWTSHFQYSVRWSYKGHGWQCWSRRRGWGVGVGVGWGCGGWWVVRVGGGGGLGEAKGNVGIYHVLQIPVSAVHSRYLAGTFLQLTNNSKDRPP